MAQITVRILYLIPKVVFEFFAWEAIWGASAMLKTIYCSRIALMCVPIVSFLLMIHTIAAWPQKGDEEDHHLTRREFRAIQERNREIQTENRADIAAHSREMQALHIRLIRFEDFQARMEERMDLGMKILWAICGLLIVRVVIPLMRMGLAREVRKMAKYPPGGGS